jgi:hypothetical protein
MKPLYKRNIKIHEGGFEGGVIVDIGYLQVDELPMDNYNPEKTHYLVTYWPPREVQAHTIPIYLTKNREQAIEFAVNYVVSDRFEPINRAIKICRILATLEPKPTEQNEKVE